MRSIRVNRSKKSLLITCVVVVLLAGVFATLEFTNTTHLLHKKKVQTFVQTPTTGGAGSNFDKGESVANNDKGGRSDSNSSSAQPGDSKSLTNANADVALITPAGNFVSNHHPNLSGSPAPNLISSVCNTTPGATCTIIFTKDNIQKSLPSQTTDSGGSAYWNWRLQDIGLTIGSWEITAKATLNTQSKTAGDAQNLEVAQ